MKRVTETTFSRRDYLENQEHILEAIAVLKEYKRNSCPVSASDVPCERANRLFRHYGYLQGLVLDGQPAIQSSALREVKKLTGLSLEMVRDLVQAYERRKGIGATSVRGGLTTWGVPVSPEWALRADRSAKASESILNKLRVISMQAAQCGKDTGIREYAELSALLKSAWDLTHRISPRGLCPWCKGQGEVQENCKHCAGTAIMTRSDKENVACADPRLRDLISPHVEWQGSIVPLSELTEEEF